jgi:YVTN family beta-propeller protein
VSVIDTATNSVITNVAVGANPDGLAVNPSGSRVYVANAHSDNVSVVDTTSNTVVATVAVGSFPIAVAVNRAGTRAFVTNSQSNSVSVIDTATNTIVATVPVGSAPPGVAGPGGIAVNPSGTRLYVVDNHANTASVIDTTTNAVVATVAVGASSLGVALNPAGTRAYVASIDSNSVSVIDTASNAVIATVAGGIGCCLAFGQFIMPAAGPGAFDLNRQGLTGSWFQGATSGQGVELEIYPDLVAPGTGYLQGAWFTYDYKAAGGAASQRWYTFSGNVQSGQASANLTLYENTGGNFNAAPATSATPVGTVVFSAADCAHTTMSYSFNDGSGRSGSVPMMRLLPNVTCVASGAERPSADFGYSGNWFDTTTPGQGIVFELNPDQPLAWLAWYTYARNGQGQGEAGQRWYTAEAGYTPGTRSVPMTLYETTGGLFDASTPVPVSVPVGSATATFTSCTALRLAYTFTGGENSGASGTINMTRVGPTPIGCGP